MREHRSLLQGLADERVWELEEVLVNLSEERNGVHGFCVVQDKNQSPQEGLVYVTVERPHSWLGF